MDFKFDLNLNICHQYIVQSTESPSSQRSIQYIVILVSVHVCVCHQAHAWGGAHTHAPQLDDNFMRFETGVELVLKPVAIFRADEIATTVH